MTVTQFTPLASTIGGVLIGASAVILMLFNGRIAGISGILGRLLPPYDAADPGGAAAFVIGLLTAPLFYAAVMDAPFAQTVSDDATLMIPAGLLVGFGAAYGGGCTSGHGVCGLARLSLRSLIATPIFMGTGFVTVFLMRHVMGA
jgi:uncharacterized membrane protein YedE/YeeE